jgi:uncharacterized protein YbbC (DUF1343 family)
MNMQRKFFVRVAIGLMMALCATSPAIAQKLHVGAERMAEYLPLLQGKRVALLVNQTSRVGSSLLPDTLLRRGVKVVKLFVPEHGFRGTADAGAHVASGKDAKTGLPIVSLYGANKKPSAEQMKDVDILVYDLQDVGARFYTYISTLQYAMEASAERGVPILVLDRPNPNRKSISGPVLDTSLRSFVGMQPIPILYGMTAGEYAKMLVGERWFRGAASTKLTVIPCGGYDGKTPYTLPVPPSPNLRTGTAVENYGWMCLFEGTVVSLGRGTDHPFEQWGHPDFKGRAADTFTPRSMPGASKPPLEGKLCYGEKIYDKTISLDSVEDILAVSAGVDPTPLIKAYSFYGKKDDFFNPFFEKLAGTRELRRQIKAGMDALQIVASWTPGLERFKKIRKKYLIYPDGA